MKIKKISNLLILLGIIVLISIIIIITSFKKNNYRKVDDKLYTVREITNVLKTNPNSLKNKSVKVEAIVVNAVKGVGCKDYKMLADVNDVEVYQKNVYNSESIPLLYTGHILSTDVYPTYHGIYQGHFFDKSYTNKCGSDNRFTIEKKIKEVRTNQPTYKTKNISSGFVISNGVFVKPPYEVNLKDYKVTINGILYEPSKEETDNEITDLTDKSRLASWEYLTSMLRDNLLVVYGGNWYQMARSNPTEVIANIGSIMKSNKTDSQKKVELAKTLDTYINDSVVLDILKNWK